ncbi:hypothetical protein [Thioalkalivibrio sp. XN8]|uniref:hypothetical protein n=1 Tax=Thioalkalivibrio sp. XN8 TaxID=2712863 RepID=UPI0013ECE2A2|nr:hypothetical protein [Thioalkalivibrio sp. XN8]NGP54639.1 hypothetical protein [Thioalkalivibrio sp. XN8]
MNKILTASFDTEEALKAAQYDLTTATIAGFPREKILADKERKEIKVMTTGATETQVRKILQDHDPKDLRESEFKG